MRYYERNGIYTGCDSLGRFFFSASKPDILPAQEWDNLNVHAVVNNNTVMRVMDGKCTEEYNLLSVEKTEFSEKGAETVYINRETGARIYAKRRREYGRRTSACKQSVFCKGGICGTFRSDVV